MMPTLRLVEVPVEVEEEEEVLVYANVQDEEVQPRKPVRIKVKIGSEYVAYHQNLIADIIVGEVFEQPPKRRRSSPASPKRRRSSPASKTRRATKPTINKTKTNKTTNQQTKPTTRTTTNAPITTNPPTTMDLPLDLPLPTDGILNTWREFDLPLPTDGILKTWKEFGDKGGYQISKPHWDLLYSWVAELRSKPDYIADRVFFFELIADMKTTCKLVTPRDQWAEVLPKSNSSNFFWATLMLMICTPLVPDTKIIDVFARLFKDYPVTEEWVLELGEKNLADKLAPLGMNKKSASNIIHAAKHLRSLRREPRDYRELQTLDGVGAKIALVTIQEVHGKAQGVPCDIHMCRIFKVLDWIPSFSEKESASASCLAMLEQGGKEKEKYDYELARAAMEGWFPPSYWIKLNQTWAGLGQLLKDRKSRVVMAEYVDNETLNFNSPWRVGDKNNFLKILRLYMTLGNEK
jgi:endonuclease III